MGLSLVDTGVCGPGQVGSISLSGSGLTFSRDGIGLAVSDERVTAGSDHCPHHGHPALRPKPSGLTVPVWFRGQVRMPMRSVPHIWVHGFLGHAHDVLMLQEGRRRRQEPPGGPVSTEGGQGDPSDYCVACPNFLGMRMPVP